MKLLLTIVLALVAFAIIWPLLIFVFKLTLGLLQLAFIVVVLLLIVGFLRRLLRV